MRCLGMQMVWSCACLVIREDPERVQLDFRREPGAARICAPNDAGHEGSMAEAVLQSRLVRPIGALPAIDSPALTAFPARTPA